jgi:hypothetical protein
LVGFAGVVAIPWSGAASTLPEVRDFDPRRGWLADSESLVATLGEQLLREDPATARLLARWVESELPLWARIASPSRRGRLAREHLLTPPRIGRDFERDETLTIDGWVLARTEAAVAVYLSYLSHSSRPSSPSPLDRSDHRAS